MILEDSILMHLGLISLMGYSFYRTGIQVGINRAVEYLEYEGLIELEADS
jgi:hypothetical protein